MVEYLERLHGETVRIVVEIHVVIEAEVVTDGRKDRI